MKNEEKEYLLGLAISNLASKARKDGRLHNLLASINLCVPSGSWVGLYLYSKDEDVLLLGPFVGKPACEEIPLNKGVVGACFVSKEMVYVDDVTKRKDYICCDVGAAKELCLPLLKDNQTIGVLDIDFPKQGNLKEDIPFFKELSISIINLI